MKSNSRLAQSRLIRISWLLALSLLLAGTFSSFSVADSTGPISPPQCPPDSLVDTCSANSPTPVGDPLLPETIEGVSGLGAGTLYDLLLLATNI